MIAAKIQKKFSFRSADQLQRPPENEPFKDMETKINPSPTLETKQRLHRTEPKWTVNTKSTKNTSRSVERLKKHRIEHLMCECGEIKMIFYNVSEFAPKIPFNRLMTKRLYNDGLLNKNSGGQMVDFIDYDQQVCWQHYKYVC